MKYGARRNKTAPMSDISKLCYVRDTIVEVFTFLLKQFFRFSLFILRSYGMIHYSGIWG